MPSGCHQGLERGSGAPRRFDEPHSVSFELVAGFFWIQVKCHTAPRASCSRPNRRSSSKKKLHHTKMLSVLQFSIAVRACQLSEQANVAPLDDRLELGLRANGFPGHFDLAHPAGRSAREGPRLGLSGQKNPRRRGRERIPPRRRISVTQRSCIM